MFGRMSHVSDDSSDAIPWGKQDMISGLYSAVDDDPVAAALDMDVVRLTGGVCFEAGTMLVRMQRPQHRQGAWHASPLDPPSCLWRGPGRVATGWKYRKV